jgi:two-component system, NarL family, nitrate/nitrite response regulator NarL
MRILVVDNVRFTADLIAATLLREPAVQAVDSALDVEQTRERLSAHSYDELLVNGALPDGAALALTRYTAEHYPQTHVLVYGLENLDTLVLSYCEAGAVGYLSSEDPAAKLVKAVQAAANGEAFTSPHIAKLLMHRLAELTALRSDMAMEPARYEELTARQKEVLHLIAQGLTNEEIADHLTVAIGTVKNHVHNVLDKLNLVSRQDAATYLSLVKAEQ